MKIVPVSQGREVPLYSLVWAREPVCDGKGYAVVQTEAPAIVLTASSRSVDAGSTIRRGLRVIASCQQGLAAVEGTCAGAYSLVGWRGRDACEGRPSQLKPSVRRTVERCRG